MHPARNYMCVCVCVLITNKIINLITVQIRSIVESLQRHTQSVYCFSVWYLLLLSERVCGMFTISITSVRLVWVIEEKEEKGKNSNYNTLHTHAKAQNNKYISEKFQYFHKNFFINNICHINGCYQFKRTECLSPNRGRWLVTCIVCLFVCARAIECNDVKWVMKSIYFCLLFRHTYHIVFLEIFLGF